MILLAAFLLLVAVGLLATGIAQGSSALEWASFAASAAAAAVLVVGELRRRRADRAAGTVPPADVPSVRSPQRAAPPAGPPTDPAGSVVAVGAVAAPSGGAGQGSTAIDPAPGGPDRPVERSGARSEPGPGAMPAPEAQPASVVQPASVAQPAPEVQPAPGADPAPERATRSWPDPDPVVEPVVEPAHAARHSAPEGGQPAAPAGVPVAVAAPDGEPPTEEVEFTDLLLIMDLRDEVLVVDEHPHYHLAGCPHVTGVETFPMPMDEARTDGFTPCGVCAPDRHIAERERARRAS